MTENEAIEIHKRAMKVYETEFDKNQTIIDLYKVSIKSLEEIQQYRALGTVEEFKSKINDVETLSRMYEKLSDKEVKEYRELNTYKEIGTIEEISKIKNDYMEAIIELEKYKKLKK